MHLTKRYQNVNNIHFLFIGKTGLVETIYKVRDTKDFNGKNFHFCDATSHRNKIKWHTHPDESCGVRK